MNACGNVRQWMLGALDSRLGPEEARALQMHLQACPRCRATWAALQEVDRTLSARPVAPVPAGFAERTLARLEARATAMTIRPKRVGALGFVAGATLVVCSLLLWWAALLGLPVLLSQVSPAVWSGLRLVWEALTALVQSLVPLVDLLMPSCRVVALAAAILVFTGFLAAIGRGLRQARQHA